MRVCVCKTEREKERRRRRSSSGVVVERYNFEGAVTKKGADVRLFLSLSLLSWVVFSPRFSPLLASPLDGADDDAGRRCSCPFPFPFFFRKKFGVIRLLYVYDD